jgi:hypothetical protein
MSRTTRVKLVVIAVAVTVIGFAIFWWCFEPVHLRVRLLCKTDHQALLEACQDLSRQVASGKLQCRSYRLRPWPWPPRAVSKLPRAIRTLRPTDVSVNHDGRVIVEMFGGFTHFGVYAYPESYEKSFPGFKYGDRQLIPNLWYYDDEYHKDADFDRTIDAIMKRFGEHNTRSSARP